MISGRCCRQDTGNTVAWAEPTLVWQTKGHEEEEEKEDPKMSMQDLQQMAATLEAKERAKQAPTRTEQQRHV